MTCVYPWLIHVDVWQKPTQHCKAIIFQLKINKFSEINKIKNKENLNKWRYSWIRSLNIDKMSVNRKSISRINSI